MMKKAFVVFVNYFEPVCIVALITSMTAIICLQIILRLFNASLSGAEEIARFLFVWAMYLSISYAIRVDRHIRLSVLTDKLPVCGKMLTDNCADLVFLIYSVTVFIFGWKVIERSLELGQIAPATEVPIAVIYCSVAVSAAISVLHLLWRLYQRATGKECRATKPLAEL